MIFLQEREPLGKWVELAGWASNGPFVQKPVLAIGGWVTILGYKNKPLSDKMSVMNITYIQQQPLKHI